MGRLTAGEWRYILDLLAFGYAVEVQGLVPALAWGSGRAGYLVLWSYEKFSEGGHDGDNT